VRSRERPKPHKGEKPQAKANKRLTEQIRKILGKHYEISRALSAIAFWGSIATA